MVIVKMNNCTYDEWKKVFDESSESDAEFMRDVIVGKVDNNTAKLATSLVNAQASPPVVIDIQSSSTGQAHGFRFNNRKAGWMGIRVQDSAGVNTPPVSYTHLRAHET